MAIATEQALADCEAMLARDGNGGYTLVHEYGVDFVEPQTRQRTVLVKFPSFDPKILWSRLVAAGICAGDASKRSFACASCDGSGRSRDEGPNGEVSFVTCASCTGELVFVDAPQRMTHALALAGDWERVLAFEAEARVEHKLDEVAWRVSRGEHRRSPEQALTGPEYAIDRSGNRDSKRIWAYFPEL